MKQGYISRSPECTLELKRCLITLLLRLLWMRYRPDQPTVNAPTGQTSQQNTSSFLADQHLRLVLEQDSDFKNLLILNVLTKEEYIII